MVAICFCEAQNLFKALHDAVAYASWQLQLIGRQATAWHLSNAASGDVVGRSNDNTARKAPARPVARCELVYSGLMPGRAVACDIYRIPLASQKTNNSSLLERRTISPDM